MSNNEQGWGRWLTPALLGAVAGMALQLQQAALWANADYAWMALAAGIVLLARPRRRPQPSTALVVIGLATTCLTCTALAFALTGLRAAHFAQQALDPALEGRDISVTGVVAAMPVRADSGLRFRFEVESAQADGAPVRLVPQLQLSWWAGPLEQSTPPDLRAGERWRMNVRLKAPHGNSNPHGFDYELWLWEQGVQATGYVRSGARDAAPQRVADTWRHPVERARQAVRDRVFAQVPERRAAGLLAALIVGDQAAIDRADWDVFRATGVAHLMSISGLHVTMFAWAAALLVGALWRRSPALCLLWPAQHVALVGGVALAAGYALFSGWGVPAQRTVWMLATVGLLRLSGRHWPWPPVWLLACAVVAAIDPWALLQPGFWLSFVAVGVLFATDAGAPQPRLLAMLREQWVVTLALSPLSLLLFGQVSLVGLLANALAIPWVTLLTTPLAMAGVLWPALWQWAAWSVSLLELWLQWLATWPLATLSMPAAPLWAGVAGVLGGVLLAMRLPWQVRLLGLPLLLPVLCWQVARPAPGQFELLAADVGQGNAVIVRTASHTLLYDSGPRYGPDSDAGHRVLVPLLRALDEPLHTLLLSHRDSDHTGGAAAVLAMQPQAALLSSIEDTHELQAQRRATRCVAGQRWQWDGVDFQVLHPQATDYAAPARSNAMSCVLRITNGRQAALLAGDIELAQEARLVADSDAGAGAGAPQRPPLDVDLRADLRADLLLVPHHGSKTSSSEPFLDAVRPSLALVQAGYRNRFGHPAAPVTERYRQRGIALFDSPGCGAARWRSEQPGQVLCHRALAQRYWRHRPPS